ncbi:NAD(P)-dependent oxidoreductase [Amycolatopsis umgeniensis]|uniref:3-hydroxyisobutyrate dehydrogenase-like beta-hydroxyacid dehydrogenase n=1 Tax=Amycolatopsis umgeniensis TaxID=336628 RepID=A0A841AUJ3_9PSEU|nr:NAD(P)-binding domain-containing protein [Amycolatopsis umgeniensis]MBB5849992.1 3-hydroxyisobutyrate dehydrogenase-like beta-hydroxyacid dehydrogenase [Amycolatopsis umgeniensis]
MTEHGKTPVTVLGLGAMGTALVEALLTAGHPVTAWNRTASRAEGVAAKGATVASTVSEALAANKIVITCLLDYDSVHEVLDPVAAGLEGRQLINLTNGTPGQAREMNAWAEEQGAEYLDGGIMAVPPMIGSPQAFIFYSGSGTVLGQARSALDTFGGVNYLGVDPGLAPLHDLALLSGMYGNFIGVIQAFTLVGSAGVKAREFAPLLRGWMDAMNDFLERAAEKIDDGDYVTGVVSNIEMQAAAFPNLAKAAEEQGVSAELLMPLGPLMDKRVAAGYGAEDLVGVIELLKK